MRAASKAIEDELQKHKRVYLVLINSPMEAVIAGEPSACEAFIRKLRCESRQIPVTDVVHCEPVQSEYEEIKKVHTNKVVGRPNIKFYSAADYAVTDLESLSLIHI